VFRLGEAIALLEKQEALCLEVDNKDGLQRERDAVRGKLNKMTSKCGRNIAQKVWLNNSR
jgi:hypothetical protein